MLTRRMILIPLLATSVLTHAAPAVKTAPAPAPTTAVGRTTQSAGAETSRCENAVGEASLLRMVALFRKNQLDPTRIEIEIARRMLVFSDPKLESWKVFLRLRLDNEPSERSEVFQFDATCGLVRNEPWAQ